jgi:hypothetical protein
MCISLNLSDEKALLTEEPQLGGEGCSAWSINPKFVSLQLDTREQFHRCQLRFLSLS